MPQEGVGKDIQDISYGNFTQGGNYPIFSPIPVSKMLLGKLQKFGH